MLLRYTSLSSIATLRFSEMMLEHLLEMSSTSRPIWQLIPRCLADWRGYVRQCYGHFLLRTERHWAMNSWRWRMSIMRDGPAGLTMEKMIELDNLSANKPDPNISLWRSHLGFPTLLTSTKVTSMKYQHQEGTSSCLSEARVPQNLSSISLEKF